tara:strand:- start:865 stop:1284 length:420 start_codon:yes stop_codon:yes gene_type:complete
MGNNLSINKINFEDMKYMQNDNNCIIINTMDSNKQNCLIKGTLFINDEEKILNNLIQNKNFEQLIIIYGENSCDNKIIKKYNQLIKLNFTNVYIYPGGLFEWLLLQDIYGYDLFTTTTNNQDFLIYKGEQKFNNKLTIK